MRPTVTFKPLLTLMLLLHCCSLFAQFPAPYCSTSFPSGVRPITLVSFAGINRTSSAALTSIAHEDHLNDTAVVEQGFTYPIKIKGNTDGPNGGSVRVFIDWNQDGDFADPDEPLMMGNIFNSNGVDAVELTANIAIPLTAATGNTRMRVVIRYNGSPAACNTGGFGQAEDYTLKITPLSCVSPSAPVVANVSAASADLSWNSVSGSSGYEYAIVSSTSPQPPLSGTSVGTNSYTASGLQPGVTYEFYVRNNCGNGDFSPWVSVPFTTLYTGSSCLTPSGLVVTDITSNGGKFSWNNLMANVSGYEYAITLTATPPSYGTTISSSFQNVTGLSSGTSYYFHLRSQCGFGGGDVSPWVSIPFSTLSSGCAAPTGITFSNITTGGVTASWNPVAGASFDYVINQSIAPPIGQAGINTSNATMTETGLSFGTEYYLHLRTKCGNDYSPWVTDSFTTATPSCIPPSNVLAVTSAGITNINWVPVTNAVHYEYEVNTTGVAPTTGTVTTASSVDLTNLQPLTFYNVFVRAYCGGSDYSDWSSASFATPQQCDTMINLSVSNISYTGAEISWTAVIGGSGYEYILNQSSAPPTAAGNPITATSYTATGLNNGTTYYFHIRTDCLFGNYSPWLTISFTTTACDTPGNMLIKNITTSSADIVWEQATGGTEYEYALSNSPNPPASGAPTLDTFYIASGLSGNTTYYMHLRTHCGNNIYSKWTTLPFITQDPAVINQVPYIHDVSITASPNPVTDELLIAVNGLRSGNATIQIADMLGRIIYEMFYTGKDVRINMSHISSGVYLIRYRDKNSSTAMTISKQ